MDSMGSFFPQLIDYKCSYEQIKFIVYKFNIIYAIGNKKNSTKAYKMVTFSPDEFENGVTPEQWIETARKYNPNIRIKRYPNRFWMF